LPAAGAMIDWMAGNVPAGERILIVAEPAINVPQANYLRYLDGGRHEWTTLRLDQGICEPRPNVQMNCDPYQNAVSRIPPDALWVQRISGRCRVISLSVSNLTEQLRDTEAGYIVVYGGRRFPPLLGLPPALRESGAFGLAHANVSVASTTGEKRGAVLLKSMGEPPGAIPASTNANTASMLRRCGED
jgi:hypothetical protein